MHRIAILIVLCLATTGCNLVDFGIARNNCPSEWQFGGAAGYAEFAWPANNDLLSADLFGGPNGGTLVSVDVWRLLHLELGLLGLGVGIGPLQFGGGVGFYTPSAPAMMDGMCPFAWTCDACGHLGCKGCKPEAH
jgi:hypothetical protein